MILGENPGVQAILKAMPTRTSVRVDGDHVWVTSDGFEWAFRSSWIGEGFPSDLHRLNNDFSDNAIAVITARRISAGTRKELDARGASWADLTGRAQIQARPGFLVDRLPARSSTLPPPSATKWSDSAGAVAETLLHLNEKWRQFEPNDRSINAAELAELCGYSYPQVNKVLQQFDSAAYVENIGSERGSNARRVLLNPSALLSDWAGWHKDRVMTTVELQTLWRGTEQSIDALHREAAGPWALTGWIAADVIAPLSTAVPNVSCYVDRGAFERTVERLVRDDSIEYSSTGGRLIVAAAEPHVIRMSQLDGPTPTVSPIRIYGDLIRIGGRGEEAAQHLREVVLGY